MLEAQSFAGTAREFAMNETVAAYGRVTQISHWLSALLILAMISIGLVMTRIEAGPGQD